LDEVFVKVNGKLCYLSIPPGRAARRPRKTLSAWEYGRIWATERIRNCLDLRLIGEKAGDFVRKVEKSLSSTPGL
jgi:hypothetical protein